MGRFAHSEHNAVNQSFYLAAKKLFINFYVHFNYVNLRYSATPLLFVKVCLEQVTKMTYLWLLNSNSLIHY